MSIKKCFKSFFILLFTFLGLTSCGGGDDNGGGTDPDQPATYSLTISSPSSGTLSFDAAAEITENDRLLVLSTCLTANDDKRFLVLAKLIEEIS